MLVLNMIANEQILKKDINIHSASAKLLVRRFIVTNTEFTSALMKKYVNIETKLLLIVHQMRTCGQAFAQLERILHSRDFYRCRDIKDTSRTTDVALKNNFMLVLNTIRNEQILLKDLIIHSTSARSLLRRFIVMSSKNCNVKGQFRL